MSSPVTSIIGSIPHNINPTDEHIQFILSVYFELEKVENGNRSCGFVATLKEIPMKYELN